MGVLGPVGGYRAVWIALMLRGFGGSPLHRRSGSQLVPRGTGGALSLILILRRSFVPRGTFITKKSL